MAQKPSVPQAVPNAKESPATPTWLFLFYQWVVCKIDTFTSIFSTTDFVVGTASSELGAERVATDTASLDVDISTTGQIKWSVTHEYVQDLVGALVVDSADLDFTYTDTTPDLTAVLKTTGVTAAAYGSASAGATFTVDSKGRLTAAANAAISITSGAVTDFAEAAQDAVGGILTDSATIDFTYNDGAGTLTADVIPGGIDHGALADLTADDHTQYVLLAGRSGGQVVSGGTGAGDDLTLRSTSNATKGDLIALDTGGNLILGGAATASEMRFMEPSGSGTNYSAFKAQAQAGNVTYILPSADAAVSGYALKSDGSGNLSWGAAGGEESKRNISQTSHGFSAGNVVYFDGTNYVLADCDSEATAEVVGIVSASVDSNTFTLVYGGYITGLSGLTAGAVHFLSSTAGALTTTEPSTAGQISKPLLIANSTTTGYFFNMRGQEIGGGVAGVREITSGTATAGQTTLTVAYTPGYVDVYVNSVRLLADDYTATNGTSIVLDTGMALNDEWVVVVWTVVALAQIVAPTAPGGRLTLATATPVMATEQAAKQTIYYTPYVGDLIPIYDGTAWNMKRFTELTLSMAGSANWAVNSNYDLYVYNDGGTLRLGTGAAWTNDTTRSESLTMVNGVYMNAATMTLRYGASSTVSAAAQRATYVGTMRTTGNTGETTWELGGAAAGGDPGKLFLWNCYNRRRVEVQVNESTDSWAYTTLTIRS